MPTLEHIRAPRRDATLNRAALLDAARALLNTDPNASLEAIAARAGLTRRAVYGHFATRDALIEELTASGVQRFLAALEATPTNGDPLVDLALVGIVMWDDVAPTRVMTQQTLRSPRIAQLTPALTALHDRVSAALVRAVAREQVRTDLPVETVARLVQGAAFAVLDEVNETPRTRGDGVRLLLLALLGAVGLSWRESESFIDTNRVALGLDAGTKSAR